MSLVRAVRSPDLVVMFDVHCSCTAARRAWSRLLRQKSAHLPIRSCPPCMRLPDDGICCCAGPGTGRQLLRCDGASLEGVRGTRNCSLSRAGDAPLPTITIHADLTRRASESHNPRGFISGMLCTLARHAHAAAGATAWRRTTPLCACLFSAQACRSADEKSRVARYSPRVAVVLTSSPSEMSLLRAHDHALLLCESTCLIADACCACSSSGSCGYPAPLRSEWHGAGFCWRTGCCREGCGAAHRAASCGPCSSAVHVRARTGRKGVAATRRCVASEYADGQQFLLCTIYLSVPIPISKLEIV